MTQFAQRLGFDLTDAFAGDVEIPADLFEGVVFTIDQKMTKLWKLAK